jgi:hypothetical protein
MSFLGEPSAPFHFARAADDELPFSEPLVVRAGVVSFASSFRGGGDLDGDVGFLKTLPLGNCWSGAADLPIQPFVCDLDPTVPLTAREVLGALKASRFRSEHIESLDALTVPFPGYQPGTDNDEIHDDPAEQYLFVPPGEGDSEAHDRLRAYVDEHHLWYVALHTVPKPSRPPEHFPAELQKTYWFSDYVILFAVGRSHDHLVGVISHQVCHNLCD